MSSRWYSLCVPAHFYPSFFSLTITHWFLEKRYSLRPLSCFLPSENVFRRYGFDPHMMPSRFFVGRSRQWVFVTTTARFPSRGWLMITFVAPVCDTCLTTLFYFMDQACMEKVHQCVWKIVSKALRLAQHIRIKLTDLIRIKLTGFRWRKNEATRHCVFFSRVAIRREPITFPEYLKVSNNYFDKRWSGARRLKNVIMVLEHVPNLKKLAPLVRSVMYHVFGPHSRIHPVGVLLHIEQVCDVLFLLALNLHSVVPLAW